MATKRFGYLDDLSLKNQKVGIGTSTANEKLEVLGGTRSGGAVVTGIATLTSYSGFQNKNTSYVENVNIIGGESGTTSDIVIGAGLTMSVGTGATTGQGSIKSLKVSNTFTPPIGGINDRPSAPKPGAFYYNKDFRTIEFWDGNFWRQVENRTSSGRAVFAGGYDKNPHGDATKTQIDYFNLSTGGDALNFGDLVTAATNQSGTGNKIRGLYQQGYVGGGHNVIQYITIASKGDSIDFGDNDNTDYGGQAVASSTRAVLCGGSGVNTMSYVQIMTTGNSVEFGDAGTRSFYRGSAQSPVRGILYAGNYNQVYQNKVSTFIIASKGNTVPWGESSSRTNYVSGGSNSVRGIFSMGKGYPTHVAEQKTIESCEIASSGLGVEFGELTEQRGRASATSSQTRVVIAGGQNTSPSSPANKNKTAEYVNIASRGNGVFFGDLTVARDQFGGTSDCHGGLGGF